MLPQGMFSVAVATVLFPVARRFAAGRDFAGLRALDGHGGATRSSCPWSRRRPYAGTRDADHPPGLRARGIRPRSPRDRCPKRSSGSRFSLPFAGANLLLTRTFFASSARGFRLRSPRGLLVVNGGLWLALYRPLGVAGLVIGTAVASAGMTLLQAIYLRRELHGRLEGGRTLVAVAQMSMAAAALGAVSYLVWWALDSALGRSIPAQIVSVAAAAVAGFVVYAAAVRVLRIPEARRIEQAVAGRLRRRR